MIEIIVVLAALALLAALAAPALLGRAGEARFDERCAAVEGAMSAARAMASRQGRAVRVWAVRDPSGVWAIEAETVGAGADAGSEPAEGVRPARRLAVLDAGYGFAAPADEIGLEGAGEGDEQPTAGAGEAGEEPAAAEPERVWLALYTPDGGVTPGRAVDLTDAEGRRARVVAEGPIRPASAGRTASEPGVASDDAEVAGERGEPGLRPAGEAEGGGP